MIGAAVDAFKTKMTDEFRTHESNQIYRWKFAKEVWYTFDLARVHHWISLELLRPSHDGPKPQNPEQWPGPSCFGRCQMVTCIIQRSGIVGCTDTKANEPMKSHELIWIDHQKNHLKNPSNNSHQSHQHKIQTTYHYIPILIPVLGATVLGRHP